MKNKNKTTLLIIITVLFALGGILLPGMILVQKNNADIDAASVLSSEYYSGTSPTISRNASLQLSSYQKMMLISGAWESETTIADPEESTITKYQAATMARTAINNLNFQDLYPCSIDTGFKNWCTWDSTLYKSTDVNFHTYTAYFWKVSLELYDGTEQHTIYLMEDGTLLCAYTNLPYFIFSSATDARKKTSSNGKAVSYVPYNGTADALPLYPDVEIPWSRLRIKDACIMVIGNDELNTLSKVNLAYNEPDNTNEYYYLYQLISDWFYMYTIIPYQP